jgi:hypothetical protein
MSSVRCFACGSDVAAESRFCAHCGANLAASAVVTAPPDRSVRLQPDRVRSVRLQADRNRSVRLQADRNRSVRLQADPSERDGRFPVGIILGERYRILFLLAVAAVMSRGTPPIVTITNIATVALLMAVAIRFGVLALTAALIIAGFAGRYLVTPDFSAFYAMRGWFAIAIVLAAALWCFRNALGGRKLLKTDLLDA